MPALLAITSSPRGDYSVSNLLTHSFVDAWKSAHNGTVVTRDLYQTDLPFVDLPWIMGAYTPADQHSPEMEKALAVSNTLIAELQAADHIVIGAPMYNFSTPAILKAWIDHIVRVGVTFSTSYEGLLKNKKVTVIISSGSIYTPGSHMESYNVESSYLKQVFGFVGMTDVNIILAGGTNDINQGKTTLPDFIASFSDQITTAAKA